MREGTSRLRLRAVLASWFAVLVVVLVATGALGGWATYQAHVAPGTVEETHQQVVWGIDGSFDHAAQVTEENPVFDTGTTLTNRSAYFSAASPELDGQFTADYHANGSEPVTISLESNLVHRTVAEDTVYWRTQQDLSSTTTTVEPGESEDLAFSFNASRALEARENVTEALGRTPGEPETFVAVHVSASRETGSGPSSLVYTATLPVTYDGGTYVVEAGTDTSKEVTRTVTRTVPREYGPLMRVGGPLTLLIGLTGLLALGALHYRDEPLELSREERAVLEYRDQRTEFDEWVVRADLPDTVFDRETATVDSFADLVDFAIDSDVAVIEEPTRNQYYAVTPDLLATFEPPEPLDGRDR